MLIQESLRPELFRDRAKCRDLLHPLVQEVSCGFVQHVARAAGTATRVRATEQALCAWRNAEYVRCVSPWQHHVDGRNIDAVVSPETIAFHGRAAPSASIEPLSKGNAVCDTAHRSECDEGQSNDPADQI